MPNTFIHGVQGTFTIGSTVFFVKQFGFSYEVDAADITHTGANGFQVLLAGVHRAEGSLTFTYDTDNKPTVSPQQMKPGTVATLHLKPDGTDDFTFDALATNFSFRSGPNAGDVEVNVTFRSTGTITTPAS